MPQQGPLHPRLTPAEAERYRRDGFLFPIEVFPPEEAAAPFSPEALAIYEEIRKKQASVMMRGARGSSAGGIYA